MGHRTYLPREVLDHGYVQLIERWGSDERIIEAARMSTAKGFQGWGSHTCMMSPTSSRVCEYGTQTCEAKHVGDEKLLKFLYDNNHHTPFEMAGAIFEVKAPIMVFREWHRHRVPFSYNEMSARYIPLPDVKYVPTVEDIQARVFAAGGNKQAGAATARVPSQEEINHWLSDLQDAYDYAQAVYQRGLDIGIPKELARLPVPVGQYSVMRVSSNLRGWLNFLKLRMAPNAQKEIRLYANAVCEVLEILHPRTVALFKA